MGIRNGQRTVVLILRWYTRRRSGRRGVGASTKAIVAYDRTKVMPEGDAWMHQGYVKCTFGALEINAYSIKLSLCIQSV